MKLSEEDKPNTVIYANEKKALLFVKLFWNAIRIFLAQLCITSHNEATETVAKMKIAITIFRHGVK